MASIQLWLRFVSDVLIYIFMTIQTAALPTTKAIWKSPSLLVNPREISRVFMNFVWVPLGDTFDEDAREVKENLVTPWATGVVFEFGAGHGHLAKYLDRSRVTAYIALEPNSNMHTRLRAKAREAGFDEDKGTFLLLPYGIENAERIGKDIEEWAHKWGRDSNDGRVVDTMISMLVLCSVSELPPARPCKLPPSVTSTPPADLVRALHQRLLRPGGQFLFFEHVRSPVPEIARAQDFATPVWTWFLDFCVLGVDSVRAIWEAGFEEKDFYAGLVPDLKKGYDEWIEEGGVKSWKAMNGVGWAEMYTWGKKGESPEFFLFHQSGRCVKRSE